MTADRGGTSFWAMLGGKRTALAVEKKAPGRDGRMLGKWGGLPRSLPGSLPRSPVEGAAGDSPARRATCGAERPAEAGTPPRTQGSGWECSGAASWAGGPATYWGPEPLGFHCPHGLADCVTRGHQGHTGTKGARLSHLHALSRACSLRGGWCETGWGDQEVMTASGTQHGV